MYLHTGRERTPSGAASDRLNVCHALLVFTSAALPTHVSTMLSSCPKSLGMHYFLVYSQAAGNPEM